MAATVLSLLLSALFSVFFQGTRAWRLSDARSELNRNATKLIARLSREAQESSYSSLVVGDQAVAFGSADNSDGEFQMGTDGRPLWQAQNLYFRDSGFVVFRRRVELPAPKTLAEPITRIDFGSGEKPLSHYLANGEPLARGVTEFKVESPKYGVLNLSLKLESEVSGREEATRWQVDSSVWMRN